MHDKTTYVYHGRDVSVSASRVFSCILNANDEMHGWIFARRTPCERFVCAPMWPGMFRVAAITTAASAHATYTYMAITYGSCALVLCARRHRRCICECVYVCVHKIYYDTWARSCV